MQEDDDFVEDASPPIVVDGEYDERESLMHGSVEALKGEVSELKKQHSKRIKQLKKQLEKQHSEAKSEVNILKNQVQLLLAKFATKETIDEEEKEELLGHDDEELGTDKDEDRFNDNDEGGGEASALITTYSTTTNTNIPQNNFDINDYDDEKDEKSIASITSRRPSIRRSLIPIYDDKSDTELSFQESSYLMLMTENICTLVFGVTFSILGIAVGSLVLALVSAFDGEEGNLLNIPPDVTPQVRASQVLGAVIGILTEQDSVQGILLLRYACKSSLQIDAGDGKVKLIPPWKVILSSLSFFSVGYLFLINLVFVIVKADDVLSLFFDIVALEFVLNVDDLFFTLCKTGIFGKRLHEGSDNIDNLEVQNIPAKRSLPNRFKGCTTKILYLANFLAVFLSMTYFGIRQEQGSYSCKSVTVTYIGDEIWESAIAVVNDKPSQRVLLYSYFNGVYKQDGTHDGMPRFVEQNKETDKAFESTIPSEFIYCNDLQRWIMFHPNIYKTDNDAVFKENLNTTYKTYSDSESKEEKCRNWVARSAETKSFDLTEVSQGEWDIWVGTIQKGASLSIICNECGEDLDCNFNGKCENQECVCDDDHFGQQCQYETPCDVLVTENIEKGDRTQLLLVKPDIKPSNFTTSYGRPIYTINGLSERPDALLSVSSKSQEVSQENYEDDDFFLKTTKNETKELLQYYRVTLTFSGSRWFAAINKPDFKAEIVYNSEYHAFWEETYSDSTFLVSSSTDTGTPVGVPFFSPRRRSEKNYGNKDYGAFGILLPNADIEGVGFFQCYAYSEDCVVLDISVTTQNKTLPSNIEKYSDEDQIVSWELFKGDQVEQESVSVLLERDQLVHSYCLPPDETYTFQMKDEICKSSWWECEGPGFSGYNISVNGDLPIMEAYDAFPVSKFSFSLLRGTNDESDSSSDFCSSQPNFNVTIHTDGSPYETSWELLNSEGVTLLTGGPYSYYKSFSTFNHLACLQDADGYNFTIFDRGGDGLKSPGYYDVMIGGEYIAKGAQKFDSSSSIIFNLMNGTLLPESSSSLDVIIPEDQDNQYSLSNCSTVFTYISGLNVTQDDRVSTSLFDVSKQAYVYQEQQNDPHDPKAPCLYDGVYTYTFQNLANECVDEDLTLLKDETHDFVLHSGSICRNDTFTFMAKDMFGKAETTLQESCMNDFHLVVPSNVTSAVFWELSGSNGVILRGDKLGPLSSRLNSHRACMTPGTYKFTTWADKSAKYGLSYGKTAVTLDLDQITPIGTAMETVDISDLTFSSTTVGDIVGNYTSNIEEDDVWIIEGSGLGIGAKLEPLGNSDSFQYLYTKFSGDFAFSIKVSTDGSTSGGIMFRDTLDPNSKHYSLFTGKDGLQNLYRRTCAGCETLGLTAISSSTESVCEDSNPQICGCASLNQTDYQGTISTTINNTECLQWDVIDNPIFYRNYPNASLGENSNYCRNPDSWDRGAWCFTSSDGSSWEECNVPICEGSLPLPSAKSSIWLRVVKEKDKFRSFYKESDESEEWLQYGSQVDIRFSNPEFYVGVAATSNNNETMEASNITISAEREQREFKFTLYDEQKVLPADGEKFQEFGKAIAVDGNTMAVSDQDSVYVFIKVDEKWDQQDKLEASEGSRFTSTIALDGDTLAVAALPSDEELRDDVASGGVSVPAPTSSPSMEDNSSNYDDDRGYVYIYMRKDGMWTLQEKLVPNEDKDIVSLELDGDRLAFGARGLSDGSVYVYTRNDGKWDKFATLVSSGQERGFGCSLGLNDDTIVVGALYSVTDYSCKLPSNPTSAPSYDYGAWRMLTSEIAYPTISPTLDGESILPPTVYNESEPPTPMVTDSRYTGSAYVFILDGDDWTEHQILKPSDGQEDDRFGSSLALSNDTLVIGADRGSISGVAYVYTNDKTGNWTEVAKLKPSKPDETDEFSYSVAVNEDTIVIGAPFNDLEGGSIYVFRRASGNIWKEQDMVIPNAEHTEFGYAVSLDGNSIYVGARYDDNNDAGVGAIYELFTPLAELEDGASSLHAQSTDSPASSPPSSSSFPSSAPNIASPVFLISSGRVREQVDHESICKSEFGSEWKVADWEYDIKALAEADVTQLMNLLGILPIDSNLEASDPLWGDGYFVTNDENKYYDDTSQRVYNFQYIAGDTPSWFLAHDLYADGLILGSWYDIERYVLCKNSEAEFLSFFDPIDGYTFVGKGCCQNSDETLIPSNTIYEANDIEECAKACKEKYSLDDSFVGINFLSQSTWTICNCMMDEKNNGAITYASDCGDELCYSYNDPTISLDSGSCTDVEFDFSILSDEYPSETTWALSKVNTTEAILRGFADKRYTEYQYKTTMCLENAQYEFTIYDSYGDGLTGGGQYNVTVGGTVIMEGGDFSGDGITPINISESFSIPFTEMPSSSPSTSMSPTHQPSMSLVPSTSSSPTLSFSPSNVPSMSMAPSSCFDIGINVTTYLYSNGFWALSMVSNVNGTRDELIIDNSLVKLRVNGLLYTAFIFENAPDENATGLLCNCGLGMIQCDDCQDKVCLIEQGDGGFSNQVSNCENGGGIASVIYSNVPGPITPQYIYGTTPNIPAVYISQENGHYLLNNEIGTTVDLVSMESASTNEDTLTRNAEESLCLSRGEYHFTYREYYCYENCYYNITIGGEMVIQGEMQSEEETVIPFSIPFVASTSPSVSPSWAFFPSISPSITTQPTKIPSSLPSISPSSSLSPTQTPSIMPSIDCSDDVRAKFYIGYSYDTSWTISRIIRSNAQVVFEGKPQNSGSFYEYNEEYELCLHNGEYKFTKIGYYGSYRIVIGQTAIAQSSGEYSFEDGPQEIVSFTIPYIGSAVPTKAPTSPPIDLAFPTYSPTNPFPTIDGFTFQGKGSCRNSEGNTYLTESIDGVNDVGACAEACKEAYLLDDSFVGVNFYQDKGWCDCLMDDNGEKGKITGSYSYGLGVGYEVILCYSYNDHSTAATNGDVTSLPTYPPTTPSIDTIEPNSSSLNPLSSPPSSSSSISPAVVAVELRTKRVRHHSLPNPVQEKKNALDE